MVLLRWIHVLSISLFICSNGCDACSDNKNCLTVPVVASLSEDHYVQAMRCHSHCLQEYNINLPIITMYETWSSINISILESNCYNYQKVEQCQLGCLTRFSNPNLKVKQCRDQCYSYCRSSCNQHDSCDVVDAPCSRKCRKTFCRKGCSVSNEFQSVDESSILPPASNSAPVLIDVTDGHYEITLPTFTLANNTKIDNKSIGLVNFLFKVEEIVSGIVRFYWMTDLLQTLNLLRFSCREVNVSFAVVSNASLSQYSPETTICIVPSVSRLPSQVNAEDINFEYVEDWRQGYTGYAVIIVNWKKPKDFDALSFYEAHVLSTSVECGGKNRKYSYKEINANTTTLVVQAYEHSGFPRFGCNYQLILKSFPTTSEVQGTQVSLIPKLLNTEEQNIFFHCSLLKTWQDSRYSITIAWKISSKEAVKNIDAFLIQAVLEGTIYIVQAKNNQTDYNITVSLNETSIGNKSTINFLIKFQNYNWRFVSDDQKCELTIFPPDTITNVSVTNYSLIGNRVMSFSITWKPIKSFITNYEVVIGDEDVSLNKIATFLLMSNQSKLSAEIQIPPSIHCVHIRVRAIRMEAEAGNWSQSLVLPADKLCTNSSIDFDFTKNRIFYASKDATSKLANIFTCINIASAAPSMTFENWINRFQKLNETLKNDEKRVKSLMNKFEILIFALNNI